MFLRGLVDRVQKEIYVCSIYCKSMQQDDLTKSSCVNKSFFTVATALLMPILRLMPLFFISWEKLSKYNYSVILKAFLIFHLNNLLITLLLFSLPLINNDKDQNL